jgi:TPR repeat protein
MIHRTDSVKCPLASFARLLTLAASLLVSACQSIDAADEYQPLATAAAAGEKVAVADLRRAFLADPEFNDRMQRLAPLERQAMQLLADEPLKLGAIGSAILDIYYGSVAGHYALLKFYEHVDADEGAAEHRVWLERIETAIRENADGTRAGPYHVVSASEAQAFLRVNELTPVGSMYHSTDEVPFMMLVTARPREGRLENVYFDLTDAYEAVEVTVDSANADQTFSPGVLIGYLAQRDDSAAQASIGAYLFARDEYDNAADWLTAATRTGNILANLLLARVYQTRADDLEGEPRREAMDFALEHYLHAVAVGSDEAMFALGGLYLDGDYGADNVASGVALLKQAADLDNSDAMVWLAHLHSVGNHVDLDLDAAAGYYRRACSLGDTRARLQYARFLLVHKDQREFDPDAVEWLKQDAKLDEPEAMLLLGNLYARGLGVSTSYRRSLRWFKEAVSNAPDDANIVNEVAWALTVTNLERLRNPDYALKIMERIMTTDEQARQNPAYLDTWAAAYAANGKFERAVVVQAEAVNAAEELEQVEVIDILREHLDAFENGQTIIDAVP